MAIETPAGTLHTPFEFGLGQGNEYGYVNLVIWATRDVLPGYRERRAIMAERLRQLAERDEEFQRLLAEEAALGPTKTA